MSEYYDVIIVGAGVIGLTQAAALACTTLRVAIIDSNAAPDSFSLNKNFLYDTRVFALNHFSQRYLATSGIWEEISLLRYTSYYKVNLAFSDANTNIVFSSQESHKNNLGYIVEQSVWRQSALEVLLNKTNQFDFYWETELLSFEHQSNKINSEFKTAHNKKLLLSSDLLIGADGINSQVRKLSGIETEIFPTDQTAEIFNIKIEKPHHFEAYQFFGAHGILAFLPLNDSQHFSIVWSQRNKHILSLDTDSKTISDKLNKITAEHWGEISLVSPRYHFPLTQQQAKSYYSKNILLIGDAAHTIHPLAGQGANLGIADVACLAKRLIFNQQEKRPVSDISGLKFFNRARRSAAWKLLLLMNLLSQYAGNYLMLNSITGKINALLNNSNLVKNYLIDFATDQFCQ